MKRFKDLFEEKSDTDIVREMQDEILKLKEQLETSNNKELLQLDIDTLQRKLNAYLAI